MITAADIIGSKFRRNEIIPFLVQVELLGDIENSFQRVRETLTRIGVSSRNDANDNILHQTCHILNKKGKTYIVHFKHLFILDDRENNITENDIGRSNLITKLLQDWGLLKVINPAMIESPMTSLANIKVVKHHDKHNWKLVPKYAIGEKVRREVDTHSIACTV